MVYLTKKMVDEVSNQHKSLLVFRYLVALTPHKEITPCTHHITINDTEDESSERKM